MLVVALPHTLPRRWSLLLVISTECSPLTPPLPLLGTGFRGVGFLEEGVFLVYRSVYKIFTRYYVGNNALLNVLVKCRVNFRTEIILLVLDQSRLLFDSEPKHRECLFQLSW